MSLLEKHRAEGLLWGIWRVDEGVDELLSMLPRTEEYRAEVGCFASEKRRVEWLAVRVLLHALAGKESRIGYQSSGKPYLVDGRASLSVSHTQGYVAVLLGEPGTEVGIDIEHYGERVRRVVSRFLRPDEKADSYAGTDTWGMLLHWSAKEAMFKCLNADEVDFCEHLRLLPFTMAESGVCRGEEYRTPARHRFQVMYRLYADFVLTIAFPVAP